MAGMGSIGGGGGSYSLDMGSSAKSGDVSSENAFDWGGFGGDMNIGPPPASAAGFLGLDLNKPGHMLLVGSGLLLAAAVLLKRGK